tara:strand:+ start:289 stop:1572 length:1284 start_codon:yes stop_codon:yes gene_type:complete
MSSINKFRLRNGLTIVLQEMRSTPVTSFWVWYRVGSRSEHTGITGISHWVEHMQFKGSKLYPDDTADNIISRTGGIWNAMTWIDWTAYYETMPSDQIELAIELEADRMTNCLYRKKDVESERTVIISERQGYENQPIFLLSEEVHAAAFRVHPYHHEVLGDQVDIESITRNELFNHYRTFYNPSNAIVVAVGDFKTSQILKTIRTHFGKIAKGIMPNSFTRNEPTQKGERKVYLNGEGNTAYLQVSFRSPSATDPDFFPMIILDSILSGASSLNMFGSGISNKTSRLYQALVMEGLAAGFNGSLAATIDPYLYSITCAVRNDKTIEKLEQALNIELIRASDKPPTHQELIKAKKQAKAMFAYSAESVSNLGFWYGFAEILENHNWFTNYLDKLDAVTSLDVQRVAQKVLGPNNRTTGYYIPNNIKAI